MGVFHGKGFVSVGCSARLFLSEDGVASGSGSGSLSEVYGRMPCWRAFATDERKTSVKGCSGSEGLASPMKEATYMLEA